MGIGFQRNRLSPSFQHLEGLEMLEIESIIKGQWFNQSCLQDETSIETLNKRIWRASSGWTHPCTGRVAHPKLNRDRNSCTGDTSILHPIYLCIWLFICIPYNILYNKPVIVSKGFAWILWAVIASYWTWGRGLGKPWFTAKSDRSMGNLWAHYLWLASKVGHSPVGLNP